MIFLDVDFPRIHSKPHWEYDTYNSAIRSGAYGKELELGYLYWTVKFFRVQTHFFTLFLQVSMSPDLSGY